MYRALVHPLDRFLQVYEERFERTHGRLRRCVEKAAHRYLDCGIFAQGAARVHCEECGHDYLVAFSCKHRCLCPSCHQKQELLWAGVGRERGTSCGGQRDDLYLGLRTLLSQHRRQNV